MLCVSVVLPKLLPLHALPNLPRLPFCRQGVLLGASASLKIDYQCMLPNSSPASTHTPCPPHPHPRAGKTSYSVPCGREKLAPPPPCKHPCPVQPLCRHAPALPPHRCAGGVGKDVLAGVWPLAASVRAVVSAFQLFRACRLLLSAAGAHPTLAPAPAAPQVPLWALPRPCGRRRAALPAALRHAPPALRPPLPVGLLPRPAAAARARLRPSAPARRACGAGPRRPGQQRRRGRPATAGCRGRVAARIPGARSLGLADQAGPAGVVCALAGLGNLTGRGAGLELSKAPARPLFLSLNSFSQLLSSRPKTSPTFCLVPRRPAQAAQAAAALAASLPRCGGGEGGVEFLSFCPPCQVPVPVTCLGGHQTVQVSLRAGGYSGMHCHTTPGLELSQPNQATLPAPTTSCLPLSFAPLVTPSPFPSPPRRCPAAAPRHSPVARPAAGRWPAPTTPAASPATTRPPSPVRLARHPAPSAPVATPALSGATRGSAPAARQR